MKILMIGLGSIGQRHVRNLRKLFGNQVEIIAYRVRGLSHTFSETMSIRDGVVFEDEYNITSYYNLEEAFSEKPDVVFISNITSQHIPMAVVAAKNGCDLFIEKPLSDNLEQIEELKALVSEKKLVTMVGFQNRFHICLKRLKELLDSSAIGDVMSVDVEMGEFLATMHTYEDYRQTYMANRNMGGGVILNQQIHELDYISWLFGTPKSVYSINGHLSDLEIDVEDICSSIYVMENHGKEIPVYVHADFIQSPPTRRCKVIGTKGFIEVDLLKSSIIIQKINQDRIFESYDSFVRNDMFIDELKEFFKCIGERAETMVSLEAGIKSLKMALCAQESAKSRSIITMEF